MRPEEFIQWLEGCLDGLSFQSTNSDSTLVALIQTKLSQVGKKTIDFNPPLPTKNPYIGPSKNPYEIYCNGTGGNSTTVTYDFAKEKTILKG